MAPRTDEDKRFLSDKDIEEYVRRYMSQAFANEAMTGSANGSNVKFNTSNPFAVIQVFVDGVKQEQGFHYQLVDSKTISFYTAPALNARVSAFYLIN